MTDRRYDPEGYAEIECAKLAAAISEYLVGTITPAVFRACLYARGYRGMALEDEFREHERTRTCPPIHGFSPTKSQP